jgi:hypothetical protein
MTQAPTGDTQLPLFGVDERAATLSLTRTLTSGLTGGWAAANEPALADNAGQRECDREPDAAESGDVAHPANTGDRRGPCPS